VVGQRIQTRSKTGLRPSAPRNKETTTALNAISISKDYGGATYIFRSQIVGHSTVTWPPSRGRYWFQPR
jgi:hypothetical protein